MIRRGVALGALGTILLTSVTGIAQPKKATILVLRSDGNADAKLRAKVETAVLKLAKTADGQVSAGDISYVDAAAATGCNPEAPTCKDEILTTFATDEIVITTIARKPGVTEVTVRRASKGVAPREVTARVLGDPAEVLLDGVGALFSTAKPVPDPAITTPVGVAPPVDPTPLIPTPTPAPIPAVAPLIQPTLEPAPPQQHDDGRQTSRRGIHIAGVVGGGVLVLIGFGLWGAAADFQTTIDAAPKRTTADFTQLRALEDSADKRARWGNVLFIGGTAIAGLSTYLLIRDKRTANRHAMVTPTLFDHGAGIAVTFGGMP